MASKKKPSRRTNAKASHPKTEQDVREAKIELARIDLTEFIEYVIKDDGGNPVKKAPQQEVWRDHLLYSWGLGKASCIIAPMSFTKTKSIAVALPLWLLGQNENNRIIIVSSAEGVAAERLQDIQRYIEEDEQYREVFPWVIPDKTRPWTQERLNVKRSYDGGGAINSSIGAFGYKAKAASGARAELVVFDDVVSEENAFGEAPRQELFTKVTTTWLNRTANVPIYNRWGELMFPDSIIAMIGTIFHEQDLYNTLPLANQAGWCTLYQPVSKEKNCLDMKIYGRVRGVPHPTVAMYEGWEP